MTVTPSLIQRARMRRFFSWRARPSRPVVDALGLQHVVDREGPDLMAALRASFTVSVR